MYIVYVCTYIFMLESPVIRFPRHILQKYNSMKLTSTSADTIKSYL